MPETVAAYAVSEAWLLAFAAEGALTVTAEAAIYYAAYAATAYAVSYGVSELAKQQAKKAASRNGTDPGGRKVMVRSAVEPHRIVYGEVVVSGPLVFACTADVTTTQRIVEHYTVPTTAPHTVTVPFWSSNLAVSRVVHVDTDSGYTTYTGMTSTGGTPGTDQYSASAGVYTFNTAQAAAGPITVMIAYNSPVSTTKNKNLHLVIPVAGHEIDSFQEFYLDDDAAGYATRDGDGWLTTGKYAYSARIRTYTGTVAQAADTFLIAEAPNSEWTSNHKLSGRAYFYITLVANEAVFNTLPAIGAKIRGKKCYDPRSATTVWTQNPALHVRDYSVSTYGLNATSARVDDATTITAAANVCDESAASPSGGTHTRYVCDATFALDSNPIEILQGLLLTMAGWFNYSQGKIRIGAGAYVAPAISLSERDLRGPISFATKPPFRELFNTVRGRYVSDTKNYNYTDYPPISNSTYVTDDGQELALNLDFDFVANGERCQRLAKIHLERSRMGYRVIWPGNLRCFHCAIGETVSVTIAALGWSSKAFRVIDWSFEIGGGVDLVLEEENSGVYTWVGGDGSVIDTNPDTTLPSPYFTPAPTGLTLSAGPSDALLDADGTVHSRIYATWAIPASPFVIQGGSAEVQLALSSEPAFEQVPISVVVNGDVTEAYLSPVQVAQSYYVRVRFRNSVGNLSAWSIPSLVTVTTLSAEKAGGNLSLDASFRAPLGTSFQSSGTFVYQHLFTIAGSGYGAQFEKIAAANALANEPGGLKTIFTGSLNGSTDIFKIGPTQETQTASGEAITSLGLAAAPGQRYEFSVYTAAQSMNIMAAIDFYRRDGTLISTSCGDTHVRGEGFPTGGSQYSNWKRIGVLATAPASTAIMYPHIRTQSQVAASGSNFTMIRELVAVAAANQSSYSQWLPSGLYQIKGPGIEAGAVTLLGYTTSPDSSTNNGLFFGSVASYTNYLSAGASAYGYSRGGTVAYHATTPDNFNDIEAVMQLSVSMFTHVFSVHPTYSDPLDVALVPGLIHSTISGCTVVDVGASPNILNGRLLRWTTPHAHGYDREYYNGIDWPYVGGDDFLFDTTNLTFIETYATGGAENSLKNNVLGDLNQTWYNTMYPNGYWDYVLNLADGGTAFQQTSIVNATQFITTVITSGPSAGSTWSQSQSPLFTCRLITYPATPLQQMMTRHAAPNWPLEGGRFTSLHHAARVRLLRRKPEFPDLYNQQVAIFRTTMANSVLLNFSTGYGLTHLRNAIIGISQLKR